MPRPPLGTIAIILIGLVGIASAILPPPEYDHFNRRRNITIGGAETLTQFRAALRDSFLGKRYLARAYTALIETEMVTPVRGALLHDGNIHYSNFFDNTPISGYRGLYSMESARVLLVNAERAGEYAAALERCGIGFVQIIHPTKEAALQLFHERGSYGPSDIDTYVAHLNPTVRARTIDLTAYLQRQATTYAGDTYYRYGWHETRFGADLAALEISRHLTEMGVSPRPFQPGHFNSPRVTNRLFDQPEHLGRVVDDELSTMIWGERERPQWSYPPIPDGLFDGLHTSYSGDIRRMNVFNANAMTDRTALVIGDSFHYYMVPYLSRIFRRMVLFNANTYDLTLVRDIAPDIVVFNHVASSLHSERPLIMTPECPPAG